MSGYVYNPGRPRYDVTCPKCGVAPGEHCRSLKSNRVTDTHTARIDAQMAFRQQQRRAEQ